jgi:short-subunit dehydrogenase
VLPDIASLPASNVMGVDEIVDATLVGLDHGETVAIPSLPDIADWEAYEAARKKMAPNLSLSSSAMRYRVTAA